MHKRRVTNGKRHQHMAQSQHSVQQTNQTLLRPTYQNRLRVIGNHLDKGGFRDIVLIEIDGGFIVRASSHDQRRPQTLEFPDTQFTNLMNEALQVRGHGQTYHNHANLLPTGYEDFFRALGYLLDNQSATSITVLELNTHVLVTGKQPARNTVSQAPMQIFERYLTTDDMRKLLDDAFQRRAAPAKRGGFLGIF
jgi:hypothetical protein